MNRIWTDGEDLTWSTITEMLGDDESTKAKLQGLTLDLTDNLFEQLQKHKELEEQLKNAKSKIDFLKGNLGSCVLFGQKRLGYEPCVKYVHDKDPKTVKISVADGQIVVNEEYLTV